MSYFRVSENETVGRFVSELATGRWAVTDWTQLGKFLARQSNSEYFTLEVEFPSIGRRRMRVNARPVRLPREEELTLLMALEDITSSEDLAREQQRLIQQLSSPVLPFQKPGIAGANHRHAKFRADGAIKRKTAGEHPSEPSKGCNPRHYWGEGRT